MLYVIRPDNDVMKLVVKEVLNLSPNQSFDVEIKPHEKRKTRQQEKYFHKLLNIVCDFTGDDITDMKRRVAWSCDLKETFTTQDGEVVQVPKTTSGLLVSEYSVLIEAAQLLCAELDLKYPMPDYYGLEL